MPFKDLGFQIGSFRAHEMISTSPLSLLPDLSWVSPNCLTAFEMTHQLMDPPVAVPHPRQMWRKSELAQERWVYQVWSNNTQLSRE